jgi:hypothetical protein
VAGERTFGDGRFRNGKWEEQDLSDREMRFDGFDGRAERGKPTQNALQGCV